jgi:elongator complex protein 3
MLLKDFLLRDFTKLNKKNLPDYKRSWSKQLGKTPRNSDILSAYREFVRKKQLPENREFEQLLRVRKVRSLSGVAPMAVMTKPFYCPGRCIYCPLEAGLPKSYLADEPAAQRALKVKFNPLAAGKKKVDTASANRT